MQVYVLTMGEYSDRSIYGVFTSLDKARAAADKVVKKGWGSYCADIYLREVDVCGGGETEFGGSLATWTGERIGDWDEPENFYIQWTKD